MVSELNRLNTGNNDNLSGGRLFAGDIDLQDTLDNLASLSAATLASASSYRLTDATGNSGEVVSTHANITVAKADVHLGATNKTDYLAVDLLKKIGIYDYFEYVAGHNTFDYCKPDPRHLTSVIEILDGNIKKSLMIGDSETDANAAKEAGIPVILLEDGYTEKNTSEIYHNHLVKDFEGIEKIILKYL